MPEMKNTPPPWMSQWLRTRMYDESCKCPKHSGSYTTVFCGECMGRPHCQRCWHTDGGSRPHQNHEPILQAFIASHRTAIRAENSSELFNWDVSDIQVYKINHKFILHLEPNNSTPASSNGRKRCRDDQNPKCVNCTRKLMESKYSFCSIACKYYYVTGLNDGIEEIVRQLPNPRLSFRKRSRKGIPTRAPFY